MGCWRCCALAFGAASIASLSGGADGFSSGAGSCSGQGHGSTAVAAANSIAAPATASPSELVSVTISGSGYKGFLLKASGGAAFEGALPAGTQAKSCTGIGAVTQSSSATKTSNMFSLRMPSCGTTVQLTGISVISYSAHHEFAARTITLTAGAPCAPPPPPPPPSASAGCDTGAIEYVGEAELSAAPLVTMKWVLSPPDSAAATARARPGSIKIQVAAATSGWLGVGVTGSTEGDMFKAGGPASLAAIGGLAGSSAPAAYSMSSYSTPTLAAGLGLGLDCGTVERAGGSLTMRFEAQLAEGGALGFKPAGLTHLVWAVGGGTSLTMHTERGSAAVDLPAGTGTVVDGSGLAMWYVHGGLMFVGWGTLLPLGVAASSARAWVGGRWFALHRWINVVGLLLTVVGVVVAVGRSKTHFNNAHSVLGMVVTVLGNMRNPSRLLRSLPDVCSREIGSGL